MDKLCALVVVMSCVSPALAKVKPVDELVASQYVGRWYQTYGSVTVKYATELGANCVTADYAAYGNGLKDEITVVNTVYPLGKKVEVTGYATKDPSQAAVYQVALGPPGHGPDASKPLPFSAGNYIVVALGPVVEGKYDYSIVSDPTMLSLYILTRNVARFEKQYEAQVLQKVKELGFTNFLNKPRKTNQEGCSYSEVASGLSDSDQCVNGSPALCSCPVLVHSGFINSVNDCTLQAAIDYCHQHGACSNNVVV